MKKLNPFNILKRINNRLVLETNKFFYKYKFKKIGKRSYIKHPLHIWGGKFISIGSNTIILDKIWIAAKPHTGEKEVLLEIGSNCSIGHYNEIYTTKEIIIEDYVLTADRVYISDNLHGYENPKIPIIKQPIKQINTVRIGKGSWLGVGVAVIGAKIGKHCVVGANAVVTKDIPDYSVAVGIPAKVIKRYNFETKQWERTNPDGSFIK